MMLAMNTITASGQSPEVQKYTTPLMMVSSSEPSSDEVCITGSRFAGIYSKRGGDQQRPGAHQAVGVAPVQHARRSVRSAAA